MNYAERSELRRVIGMTPLMMFFDGGVLESIDIGVTSDGATVTLSLQADGGGDLTFFFGGREIVLDSTPAATVSLTAGTDTVPQLNYVYVTESGGALTLTVDTSSFPATAHAPIATVLVQSASGVQTDGAYKVHAWTDHLNKDTENGHLSHLNKKIRALEATWQSGVAPSDIAAGNVTTTAGVVFQLHTHAMPARDISSDASWVANDNTTAYKRITSIDSGGIDSLSDGTAIVNNRYVNLVLVGVVSEDDADCKLFWLLPSGQYTSQTNAEADSDNTAVYSLGTDFTGTAFLIARYTTQYTTGGGGSHTQTLKTDLRGLIPSTSPGGGAITDHGNLAGLTDDDHTQYLLVDGSRNGDTATQAFEEGIQVYDDKEVFFGTAATHYISHAAASNELTLYISTSAVLKFESTGITLEDSKRIDLESTGVTSIRGGTTTQTFEVNGNDEAILSANTIDIGGDDGDTFTIRRGSRTTGAAGDLTIQGGGGDGGTGGNLNLKGGSGSSGDNAKVSLQDEDGNEEAFVDHAGLHIVQGTGKLIFDTDEDTYITALIDDLMSAYASGSIVWSCSASAFSLAAGVNQIVSQGQRIDFDTDTDTSIRCSGDDILDIEVGGTDVLQVTASDLDGQGQLDLVNFGGRRNQFVGGYRLTSTGAAQYTEPASLAFTGGTTQGWQMPKAGSIISIYATIDINACSSCNPFFQVYKNGAYVAGCTATVSSPVVADGQVATNTFAAGTYTFSAGDFVAIYRRNTTGSITSDDFIVVMEVVYDS